MCVYACVFTQPLRQDNCDEAINVFDDEIVGTPVALLCSLSFLYLWERCEPTQPHSSSLNSITTVFLQGCLWH